jgi:regulator of cell morphogenesis and NO signaling
MAHELEQHMMKEEQILFPLILSGRGAMAGGPISVMEQEHADAAADLARTRTLTADLTPPADACNTWRSLYLRLGALESDLKDHIHLENNVLFPRTMTH